MPEMGPHVLGCPGGHRDCRMMAKRTSAYVKLPSRYCPPASFSAALNARSGSCACTCNSSKHHFSTIKACQQI